MKQAENGNLAILASLEQDLASLGLYVEVEAYDDKFAETVICFVGATPAKQTGMVFERMPQAFDVVGWLSCNDNSCHSGLRCSTTSIGFPWPLLASSAEEASKSYFKETYYAEFEKGRFLELKKVYTSFHQRVADEKGADAKEYYLKKFKYAA